MYPYFHFFGRTIPAYGLCMVLGVVLACTLTILRGKRFGLVADEVIVTTAVTVGFAVLGGSLLYMVVTFSPQQILKLLLAGKFSILFSGIVFYGGMIGAVLGAGISVRLAGCQLAPMLRAAVPFIPMGHAVGRIGCLLAGCCYGMPYEGPFAIHYPSPIYGLVPGQGYFPSPLAEAFLNVCIGLCLLGLEKRAKLAEDLLAAYLCLYALVRFTLEFFRGDVIRGSFEGLSTSQWISVGLVVVCALYTLVVRKHLLHRQEQKSAK